MRVAVKIFLPEMPKETELFIISDEYTTSMYMRGELDLCLDNLTEKIRHYACDVVDGKFRSGNTTEDLIEAVDKLYDVYNKRQDYLKSKGDNK